jgi:hypothetical protein
VNRISHVFDQTLARTPRQHVASVRDLAGASGRGAQRVAATLGLLGLTALIVALTAGYLILRGRG